MYMHVSHAEPSDDKTNFAKRIQKVLGELTTYMYMHVYTLYKCIL